jgi:hypothetical protein
MTYWGFATQSDEWKANLLADDDPKKTVMLAATRIAVESCRCDARRGARATIWDRATALGAQSNGCCHVRFDRDGREIESLPPSCIRFSAPATAFRGVKNLDLSDACISDGACMELASIFDGCVHKELETVRLTSNSIGDAGAVAICAAIAMNQSRGGSLRSIDLARNEIGDAGCESIAEAIWQNTALEEINLQHNVAVSDVGAAYLAVGVVRSGHVKSICLGGGASRIGALGTAALGLAMFAVGCAIDVDGEEKPLPWLEACEQLVPAERIALMASDTAARTFVREYAQRKRQEEAHTSLSAHGTHRSLITALVQCNRVDDAIAECMEAITLYSETLDLKHDAPSWFHAAMKAAFTTKADGADRAVAASAAAWRSVGGHSIHHRPLENPVLKYDSFRGMIVRVGNYYCPWYDVETGAGGSKHFAYDTAWRRREVTCANGLVAAVTKDDQLALLHLTKEAVSAQHAFAMVRSHQGGRFSFVTSNDVRYNMLAGAEGKEVAPLSGAALAHTLLPPARGSVVLRGCFSATLARFVGVYEPTAAADATATREVLHFTRRLPPASSKRAATLSRCEDGRWDIKEEWVAGSMRPVFCTTTTDHGAFSPLRLKWRTVGSKGRHCPEVEILSCFDALTLKPVLSHEVRQKARRDPRPWHTAASKKTMFRPADLAVEKFQLEREMKTVYRFVERTRATGQATDLRRIKVKLVHILDSVPRVKVVYDRIASARASGEPITNDADAHVAAVDISAWYSALWTRRRALAEEIDADFNATQKTQALSVASSGDLARKNRREVRRTAIKGGIKLSGARKFAAVRRVMGVYSVVESAPLRHGAHVYRRHEAYSRARGTHRSKGRALLLSSPSNASVPIFSPSGHATRLPAIATLASLPEDEPVFMYRNMNGTWHVHTADAMERSARGILYTAVSGVTMPSGTWHSLGRGLPWIKSARIDS